MVLAGVAVGLKAEIAANPYVIHRNEEIYGEDADTWRPERWLEAGEEQSK